MTRAIATVLVGVLCLLGGGPALHLALTEWHPTERDCGAADLEDLSARWLRLRGCRLSWSEAGYATVGQSVTEVYVPVRPRSEVDGAPVRLVLASRRAAHIALGEALLAAHGDADGMQRAVQAHREVTRGEAPLLGVRRELGDVSLAEREVLDGLPATLAAQVGVLDDAASPDLALGLALCIAGLACFVFAGWGLRQRRRLPT